MSQKRKASLNLIKPKRRKALYIFVTTFILYYYLIVSIIIFKIIQKFRFILTKINKFLKPKKKQIQCKSQKIAVIGAGISGSACAWNLKNNGFDVHVFEQKECIGKNPHQWKLEKIENIQSDLNLIKINEEYFHNFQCLLNLFQIKTTKLQFPYSLYDENKNMIVMQDKYDNDGYLYYKDDYKRWRNIVQLVKIINYLMNGEEGEEQKKNQKFLNKFSFLNPFNFITIQRLAWTVGISKEFQEKVVAGVWSQQFPSRNALKNIPASLLPMLNDLVPITKIQNAEVMIGENSQIFNNLLKNVKVHLHTQIIGLKENSGKYTLFSDTQVIENHFDYVIIACNSQNTAQILQQTPIKQIYNPLLAKIFKKVGYTKIKSNEYEISNNKNDIADLEFQQDHILHNYSDYIKIDTKNEIYKTQLFQNQLPSIMKLNLRQKEPMLCTKKYQLKKQYIHETPDYNLKIEQDHSLKNLAISQSLQYFQGRNGLYFCGKHTTPGKEIEQSLLSGLVIADQITDDYPFKDNIAAFQDYNKLKQFMGF